jgi:sRNA-binding carbon storage regulator CsrA
LPTELSNLVAQGKIKIKVLETPDKWLGVTNPEDEEILRQELASQN